MGKPTIGDFDCGVNLFFQILGTIVSVTSGMMFVMSIPYVGALEAKEKAEMMKYLSDVIYGKILNGMCFTMIFGTCYYSFMALRMRKNEKRFDVMCLPYGINTPAAFAFVYQIMAAAAREGAADGLNWKEGIDKTWQVGCAANLAAGFIAALVGFARSLILKVAPQASLLIPLAGLGLTYLGIAQMLLVFAAPQVGFVPLMVAILGYFVGVRYYPLPIAVVVMISGIFVGWIFSEGWEGGGTWDDVKTAGGLFGFYLPTFIPGDAFAAIPQVTLDNINVILPVAFVGAINTLVSVYNAHEAGDVFDVREALVVDGCTTMVSALFGSPFGTCVYCGHKALKDSGGRMYHQSINCVLFCLFCLTGQFAMVAALVPPYAIAPIILFVGLAICQDAFVVIEKRHLPAAIVGLMPSIAEWVGTKIPFACSSDPSLVSLKALGVGALLSSMILTSFIVFSIDGNFMQATIWASCGAFLCFLGIIHQPSPDLTFKTFTGETLEDGTSTFASSQCAFMTGYLTCAVICATLGLLQRMGFSRVPQKSAVAEAEDEMAVDKKASEMAHVIAENAIGPFALNAGPPPGPEDEDSSGSGSESDEVTTNLSASRQQ
jgi:AGZA family xanthine/uracil permease-like MFS transporter